MATRSIISVEGERLQVVPRNAWFDSLEDYQIEEAAIDQIYVRVFGEVAVAVMLWRQKASLPRGRSQRTVHTDRHLGEAGERLASGRAPFQPPGASRLGPSSGEPARM